MSKFATKAAANMFCQARNGQNGIAERYCKGIDSY